ncbi:hypothetical protein FRC09_006387 [Ceratobasidium sp. 395]|nr:hypothetical protein FRC09_006387 [Ceratobasidium sp. 395]
MNVNSQSDFDSLLSSTSGLVVVGFYAVSDTSSISFDELSAQYNVATTPTFVLLKQKEVVEAIEGNEPTTITAAINKYAPQVDESTPATQELGEVPSEPNTDEPTKNEDAKDEAAKEEEAKDETVKDEGPKETTKETALTPPEPKPPVVLSSKVLESMWNSEALSNTDSTALPPPRHFDDTLSQLRITFLPKTQHQAVHVIDKSLLVEPTLALFCPIEGGEYVVDVTVKELAQKTDAEVQVIDMAHVAAGEWGNFGKVASGFRLKDNPLGQVGSESTGDDDDDSKNIDALGSFWKALIDSNPPAPLASEEKPTSTEPTSEEPSPAEPKPVENRRRIIYIRDFGILCARSNTWFPPLYSAVRARRTGGAGPDSPISKPTTIVFGVCPPVSSIIPSLSNEGGCQCSSCRSSANAKQWDEGSTKERAARLKSSKEKWNKGKLLDDLPSFTPRVKIPKEKKEEESKKDENEDKDDSKDDDSSSDSSSSAGEDDSPEEHKLKGYFRSCVVAPAKRSTELERASREKRRRELNELMLRMMVGVKGGEIESSAAPVNSEDSELLKGWEERLLEPDALKDVVDRALATAMLSDEGEQDRAQTVVTWAQLQDAWREKHTSDEERKAWTKDEDEDEKSDKDEDEKSDKDEDEKSDKDEDEKDDKDEKEEEKPPVDEVIEKVKSADLDEYERRLLGCIVDVVKLSTTFENVHLPMTVIDSVRSIVSLPLLFPDAFKSGILKQQAISGALLFGPPGTGKTLVVRALAKESGARMLAIKPSDVADKLVGETEKLVRSVFKLARRLKPCVVFIDEIDSIMGSRQSKCSSGGSRWHTSMLTEFMQEMDGLMASSVIVIGATNRPFDIDDAVLRRLPCRLLVDLPGERAREEILKIMLRDDKLGPDVSISELAKQTDRFSGSDLKHLCVAAAMDALKESVKLPWAVKKEESQDAPSSNETPTADASKPTPAKEEAKEETKEPEKEAIKTSSSDKSDDGSSLYSSSDLSPSPASSDTTTPDESESTKKTEPEPPKPRILEARHFLRALMDVAPSSSESQGSLSELRKWNLQFGTGARDQPKSRPTTGSGLPYSYGGGVPGANGLSGYGSSGLGSSGLGSATLGSTSLGSGLGSGLGSSKFGLGPSGLGPSGLSSISSGASYPSTTAGLGAGYTPGLGGATTGTGYAPKFPVYSREIPGYNPSAPGGSPSAPGL